MKRRRAGFEVVHSVLTKRTVIFRAYKKNIGGCLSDDMVREARTDREKGRGTTSDKQSPKNMFKTFTRILFILFHASVNDFISVVVPTRLRDETQSSK